MWYCVYIRIILASIQCLNTDLHVTLPYCYNNKMYLKYNKIQNLINIFTTCFLKMWHNHPLLLSLEKINKKHWNQRLSRACIVHLVIKRTNWSYVKTMSCSGSHLGIPINIKNTKFVKDLPMIDFQLGPP